MIGDVHRQVTAAVDHLVAEVFMLEGAIEGAVSEGVVDRFYPLSGRRFFSFWVSGWGLVVRSASGVRNSAGGQPRAGVIELSASERPGAACEPKTAKTEPIGEERGKTCPDASCIRHQGRKSPYVPGEVDDLGAGVAWPVGRDWHLAWAAARQRSHVVIRAEATYASSSGRVIAD